MQTGLIHHETFPDHATFNYPVGVHTEVKEAVSIPLGTDKRLIVTSNLRREHLLLTLHFTTAGNKAGVMTAKAVVWVGVQAAIRLRPSDPLPKYEVEYFGLDDCVVFKTRRVMFRLQGPKQNEGWMNFIEKIKQKEYDDLRRQAQERKERIEGAKKTAETGEKQGPSFKEVRLNTEAADFTIVCGDDVSIPVHTAILCTFWPFFKNMMSNDCDEKANKQLRLDFPASWVNQMILHIYSEESKMTFDEATGVLIASEMYLLPELNTEASRQLEDLVRKMELSLADLVTGWERSHKANNEKWSQRFAKMIATRDVDERSEAMESWDKSKLAVLYFDTCANIE